MNEDEMQAMEPQPGETLERMLARYARVRLDPSPAETRRARAAVMEEAWRRRFELAAAAAAAPTDSAASLAARPRRRPFATWGLRRLSGALSAAVLAGLLIGTTAFATSRAGGPFYETRLALEELTLPSDAASRVEAEIAMAQTRLAEIVEASSRDDQRALSAALAAYEHTIGILGATTGGPAPRAMEAVASHQGVLERVAAMVPEQARNGLNHALAAGDTAIEKLLVAGGGKPGAGSGGNGNGNGGNGNGNGSGTGKGNAATPSPDATPDATPDAAPHATPDAAPHATPTQKPGRTLPPKPTKAPADQGD